MHLILASPNKHRICLELNFKIRGNEAKYSILDTINKLRLFYTCMFVYEKKLCSFGVRYVLKGYI